MKRRITLLVATLAVAVLLGAAGVWWFLRDDAPAEVTLDAATEALADEGADASDPTAATGSGTGVEGTWTVDTASGDFDYDSATGTFAGFRIEEELTAVGSSTAVGRTGDVTGSITIEGSTLTAAEFEVDLTTVTTNDGRRDDRVQSALDTGTYPTATFTLTEPVALPAGLAEGESGRGTVSSTGELTIHGVTNEVTIELEAELQGDTAVVVGSAPISLADYGIDPPTGFSVLSIADQGTFEFQLFFARG
jgi:polyisoprenoid-binding protein YceI